MMASEEHLDVGQRGPWRGGREAVGLPLRDMMVVCMRTGKAHSLQTT